MIFLQIKHSAILYVLTKKYSNDCSFFLLILFFHPHFFFSFSVLFSFEIPLGKLKYQYRQSLYFTQQAAQEHAVCSTHGVQCDWVCETGVRDRVSTQCALPFPWFQPTQCHPHTDDLTVIERWAHTQGRATVMIVQVKWRPHCKLCWAACSLQAMSWT